MLNSKTLRSVVLAVIAGCTCAAGSDSASDTALDTAQTASLSRDARPTAPSHETLDYAVEWRLINAGHAKVDWYESPALKSGWEAKLHIQSVGLVSRLFYVSDDYTTQMTGGLCATSTYMAAREGSRSRDTKVTYDANAKRADYFEKDLKSNAVLKKQIDIPPCVHDIIGALYALRSMNLEPGKTTTIPVANGKKSVSLKIEAKAREEIKVPSGTQKTIRYEVFAFDNQLYNRPGHLHIWLTDDARHLPVQIQIRLQFTIGTITLRLEKETHS